MQAHEVQFIDSAFRWMNCVLVREIPLPLVARMWDTYLAEGEGFSVFHLVLISLFFLCLLTYVVVRMRSFLE